MDLVTKKKWDRAAANFDLMAGYGPEKRWEPFKRKFFSRMGDEKILFLAVGTGLDIPFFPKGKSIIGLEYWWTDERAGFGRIVRRTP